MEERTMLKLLIIAVVILVASVIGNILLLTGLMATDACLPAQSSQEISVPKSISYMDYSGAYLEGADLSKANAYKTIFTGADLRCADLHGAKLTLADLSGADLSGADLIGTKLDYSNLRGADLRDADLSYSDLRGADLTNADLTGAIIEGADLRWIKGEYTI